MKLTQKVLSLFICMILSFAFIAFSNTHQVQATNNFTWKNITPDSHSLADNDGASTYVYGYSNSWDGHYLHGMTSFTDLVETKPDGSKVIHYFQFMPSSAYGFYSSTFRCYGAVVHGIYDPETKKWIWEKISPSFFANSWTAYGGGFAVLKEPYIDSNGSMWSGRLFLHTNEGYVQTYSSTASYYLYRYPGQTTVIRWDGGSNWTNIWSQSAIPNVVPGGNGYSYGDWQGTQSGKYYIQAYNGSLYIIGWQGNNPTSTNSTHYWNLRVYKYSGSTDDLVNNSSPPKTWSQVWSNYYGGVYYNYQVPGIYDFKVLNDRWFVSTSNPDTMYYNAMRSNGRWFVSTNNNPSTLQQGATAGGSSPSCFEYFKGHYYAGFYKNSDLLRVDITDPYSTVSDLGAWENCGTINDPDASSTRPLNTSILALAKTTGTDAFGAPTDVKLFIGGTARSQSATSTGTCPLYSTEGEDAGGDPDALPLQFTLEEDEWRLNSVDMSPNFQNRMYGIYDLYNSNLGLIAQFGVNSIPPGGMYTNDPEYRYRRFMVYNAPPSCGITQDPDPVVNDRGTYTTFTLTFTPTGGFGSGNVKVEFKNEDGDPGLPENIYVPTEGSGGNPINQLYHSGSIPMNGGVLNLSVTIKSTNSAVVASYRNNPESWISITDLTASITASGPFALDVIPPLPGFTPNANPSVFSLFQGECPSPTECCEDHCKQIDLDIDARNGFEDNVLIGTYWTDPPANQPEGVTVEFLRNSFVYDIYDTTGTGFTSLAEVRVRPDMGTRYAFKVRVSPETIPGHYHFRIMFLSGSIKEQIDCTMTVLAPRPDIDVNPADDVGNFSMQIYTKEVIPGGSVHYRLKIQSKAGFTGKVALALRGLPDQVYFNNPSGFEGIVAEVLVPGYAENYVNISPILDAYANVTLQTTPYTINPYPPTNLAVNSVNANLNIISWDASRRGSRPIGGYEVWRSLTRYIDAANRIAVVNSPNTSYEDADVEPNTPYYYFVRAFDNDTPANFSTYATSGRVGEATSVTIVDDELDQVLATADKMGTIPGFYTLEVIGNGVGYGPGNVPTNPSAVTYLGLHVYRQDLNLKTPFLDIWGALALLFGMMLVAWQFVFRKKEEQTF